MTISYKKLWKLLIDRNMKKRDLQELANVSSSSIAKLGKNENVNTDILVRICIALNCELQDIMELTIVSEPTPILGLELDIIDFCHATRTELDIDLYVFEE